MERTKKPKLRTVKRGSLWHAFTDMLHATNIRPQTHPSIQPLIHSSNHTDLIHSPLGAYSSRHALLANNPLAGEIAHTYSKKHTRMTALSLHTSIVWNTCCKPALYDCLTRMLNVDLVLSMCKPRRAAMLSFFQKTSPESEAHFLSRITFWWAIG